MVDTHGHLKTKEYHPRACYRGMVCRGINVPLDGLLQWLFLLIFDALSMPKLLTDHCFLPGFSCFSSLFMSKKGRAHEQLRYLFQILGSAKYFGFFLSSKVISIDWAVKSPILVYGLDKVLPSWNSLKFFYLLA